MHTLGFRLQVWVFGDSYKPGSNPLTGLTSFTLVVSSLRLT